MKNFLWFLHKPNDEREQMLYLKAYKQVLYFFLGIFVCASLFTGILGIGDNIFSAPFWVLDVCIDIIFLVCIFLGWNILRKEELDSLSKSVTRPVKVTMILVALAVILAGAGGLSQFFLEWSVLFYFVGFLLFWGVLCYLAWRSLSDSIPLLIRLYLALLYPIFVLVFSRLSSKITVRKFISRSFVALFLHLLLMLVFVLGFTLTSGPRYSVMTDHFAPDLQKGQQVFAAEFTDLKINDYIVYLGNIDSETNFVRPYIGRITSVEPALVVDSSSGPMNITRKDVVGIVREEKMMNIFGFSAISVVTDVDPSTQADGLEVLLRP